jgi:hypothetical protein
MPRRCLALHEQIVALFRHLADVVDFAEARDMLAKLAELEARAVEELGMSETSLNDV